MKFLQPTDSNKYAVVIGTASYFDINGNIVNGNPETDELPKLYDTFDEALAAMSELEGKCTLYQSTRLVVGIVHKYFKMSYWVKSETERVEGMFFARQLTSAGRAFQSPWEADDAMAHFKERYGNKRVAMTPEQRFEKKIDKLIAEKEKLGLTRKYTV